MTKISLTIDGRKISASPGMTILQAALENGIMIPNLCNDPRLVPTGSCRMCIVEIDKQPGFHTSCTRIAEDGMIINTHTDEIKAMRKTLLEFIFREHVTTCPTCDSDGNCKLQDYGYEYGVDVNKFTQIPVPSFPDNYTRNDHAIHYDPGHCIRCQRCVRICAEVQCAEALTMENRSNSVVVSTGLGKPLRESTCEYCGQCISTCPTGAIYEKNSRGKGKIKDVVKTRTTCPYCGVGCQMELNVHKETNKIMRVTTNVDLLPNYGNLCVKGRFGIEFVHSPKRLSSPLVRENGSFREITWDQALKLVSEKFLALKKQYGPDALAGLSSAKTTNEDNYIMQKFIRAVFGTNNIDHCARLCHASTVTGLSMAFGSGAMTNSINEVRRAPVIFVIGSNTTECHPVLGILIRQAVAAGTSKLIVADPRRIPLTHVANLHLQQRPGTDVALVNGMMNVILSEKLEDEDYIRERCENFEAFRAEVEKCPPKTAAQITGVPEKDIIAAARLIGKAAATYTIYSMGITQHTTGTDNVLSLANLAMLTGNVGKECTGVNPLRGQNNVQGACDMGALPNVFPGYQSAYDSEMVKKFSSAWKVPLSDKKGLTLVEMMNAAYDGSIHGLYLMGENPLLSDPDINHVKEALSRLDFFVSQDIFLTETAELAHVVLPATSFAEKSGTFTNTERRVQLVNRAIEPLPGTREDWKIICQVASHMGYPMNYGNAAEIMDEIAQLAPIYGGISHERITETGLQWPCPTPGHPGTLFLHKDGFKRGKGKFHAIPFIPPDEEPSNEYPLVLTTGRLLFHWHTGTMTRKCSVLDTLVPNAQLEMHPDDAGGFGIAQEEIVKATSRRGVITVPVCITDKVKKGEVFLTFHFKESPVNVLTNPALDKTAKIPELKVCAVRIEKIPEKNA
ncbi:MAG: formate dehydrogenase subunit alpha [Spirochaetales bacterium]|nr:formate dehydrogenase subunit alpha [Spirochaetales bacterium]